MYRTPHLNSDLIDDVAIVGWNSYVACSKALYICEASYHVDTFHYRGKRLKRCQLMELLLYRVTTPSEVTIKCPFTYMHIVCIGTCYIAEHSFYPRWIICIYIFWICVTEYENTNDVQYAPAEPRVLDIYIYYTLQSNVNSIMDMMLKTGVNIDIASSVHVQVVQKLSKTGDYILNCSLACVLNIKFFNIGLSHLLLNIAKHSVATD